MASTEQDPSPEDELTVRVDRLEERLRQIRDEVRSRRLVIEDGEGRARLVAEVVQGVMELRMDLPPERPARSTSLLLFGAPRDVDGGPGVGLQLWVDGDVVEEISRWP